MAGAFSRLVTAKRESGSRLQSGEHLSQFSIRPLPPVPGVPAKMGTRPRASMGAHSRIWFGGPIGAENCEILQNKIGFVGIRITGRTFPQLPGSTRPPIVRAEFTCEHDQA